MKTSSVINKLRSRKVQEKSEEDTKMEALDHKILSASVIVVLSLVFGYLPLILAKK